MTVMPRQSVRGFDREEFVRQRRARELTQEDVALRVGVGVAAVRGWELGRTRPSPPTYQRIVDALGLEHGALLPKADDMDALAVHRMRASLTQRDAAVQTGIALYRYREIERGVRLPTTDEVASIGHLLNIPHSEVMHLCTRLHHHRSGRS